MEKILLFGSGHYPEVKGAAGSLGMKVENIEPSYYKETLGALYAGVDSPREEYAGENPRESLMVFCGISEQKIDKLSALLRKKHIPIDYKAVMTPVNRQWNILRLYFEMEREKRAWSGLQ